MRSMARREILTGLQYLLIGILAEILAERTLTKWFPGERPDLLMKVIAWSLIACSLGLIRFVIIVLANMLRRDQWQTISRRNWI